MGAGRDFTGETLQETYRLERLIGRGGMGVVYEASHARLVRRFAVKLLYQEVASNPEAIARFRREAEITSSLGHQHIVEVIDFNHCADGTPYIVMELLEGEDLGSRIKRRGKIALPQASEIVRQAASALQAAHQKGIVHRDLKPQNLFLCRREDREIFVKVVDFGVSKMIGADTGVLTQGRALLGTPYYMAPEQALERSAEVDARSDVYALGVILYEMLTGLPPFVAESIPTLLYKIVHEEAPPLRAARPDLPPSLEEVVALALAKRPEARPPSMRALWRELAEPLGHTLADLSTSGLGALDAETSAEVSLADALGETLPPSGRSTPPPTVVEAQPPALSTQLSGELRAPPPRARGPVRLLVGGLAAVALVATGVVLATMIQPGPARLPGSAPDVVAARTRPDAPRPDAAGRADRRAIATAPDTRVAPKPAPKPVLKHAARAEPGQIWVQVIAEGEPVPAQVSLDSAVVGQAPLRIDTVKAGLHRVGASLAGYTKRVVSVSVKPGSMAKVVITLER
jgi:serine/threonine-protein kinase